MTSDVKTTVWFDRFLPSFLHAYARLARWDRPIGFWLLFWPCAWGLMLAPRFAALPFEQQFFWLGLFWIGAVAMRGAGCTVNDLWDRHLDKQVERTSVRPLASGAISIRNAIIFLVLQCLVGLAVWWYLPLAAQIVSLCYVPLIVIYPLMKRITYWPQAFLAVVFNAGVLIGWLTTGHDFSWIMVLVYVTAMFWTLGYDTVYAHMDQRDDIQVGIKSTVVGLGERAVDLVAVCWWIIGAGWLFIGSVQDFTVFSWCLAGVAFVLQIMRFLLWNPDDDKMTLAYFRFQHWFGGMLALACWYSVLQHLPVAG